MVTAWGCDTSTSVLEREVHGTHKVAGTWIRFQNDLELSPTLIFVAPTAPRSVQGLK